MSASDACAAALAAASAACAAASAAASAACAAACAAASAGASTTASAGASTSSALAAFAAATARIPAESLAASRGAAARQTTGAGRRAPTRRVAGAGTPLTEAADGVAMTDMIIAATCGEGRTDGGVSDDTRDAIEPRVSVDRRYRRARGGVSGRPRVRPPRITRVIPPRDPARKTRRFGDDRVAVGGCSAGGPRGTRRNGCEATQKGFM